MIVHLPRRTKSLSYPSATLSIKRVDKINICGMCQSNLHIPPPALVTKSARSFYAIKTIRAHSLNGSTLWDATKATLVAQLLYASPVCGDALKLTKGPGFSQLLRRPNGTVITPMTSPPSINL